MSQKTGEKQGSKATQFQKGSSGNPKGRPKGRKDFRTLFYAAIKNMAKATGEKPDEIEMKLVQKGLASARKGDYRFWKDLHDRVHGQPVKNVDHTSDGKPLTISFDQSFNAITRKTEEDSPESSEVQDN